MHRAALILLVGVTACSMATTPPTPPMSVVLVGDSLAVQTAPYLGPLLRGVPLVDQSFGGTAPCDWIDKDLGISKGSQVVISFTGNSSTPCMADGAGGTLQGQAIVDRYRADVTSLIDEARGVDADVLLVGQPVHAMPAPGVDVVAGLNDMYAELAGASHVDYVDAGAAVENEDGSLAVSLPCLPNEAECGPDGNNVVRGDDGLHFCPGPVPPGPCPGYASGAFRFASAIAEAIPN